MKQVGEIISLILLLLILAGFGCKKSQEVEAQYVLTVQCSTGVNGEPQTGSFNYAENNSVAYNYSAATGYNNLQVTLNGQVAATSGSVIMNMNHAISANTQRIMYFQGNWKLDAHWTSQTCSLQNASNLAATCTQYGDDITLTIPIMNIAANGKIDLEGNFEIATEVTYPNKTKFQFTFTGKMNGENSFSGEIKARGFLKNSPVCAATGNFSANKV